MDVQFVSIILGSSWASGINVYLTVAALGVSHHFQWVALPGSMDHFANPFIIMIALAMYAVEFCADKIPYVDSTWDAAHTFIRPSIGALAGYYAADEAGMIAQTATALVAGTITLEAHAAKASTRAAINTSPEPVTNSVASVTEDASVLVLLWLVMQHPIIASLVVIALIVGGFVLIKMLFKFFKKIFKPSEMKKGVSTAQHMSQSEKPTTPGDY